MKPVVYFIGRLIWVLICTMIIIVFVPIIYVLMTLWSFKPIQEWNYIKEDLFVKPFDEERAGYVHWSQEKYWIRETIWDYLLDRKKWIDNPEYQSYLTYLNQQNKSKKRKTVKNLKSDINDVLNKY